MSKNPSNKRRNSQGKPQSQRVHRLPQEDILAPPKALEAHRTEADIADLLAKARRIRYARDGAVIDTPGSIMRPPYTDLPAELYVHMLRVILWTHALGTPGVIPTWAVRHPAIRAKDLTAHNLAIDKIGALHLTCYIDTDSRNTRRERPGE